MRGLGEFRISGTHSEPLHISLWSTPHETRPASFERSLSALSNDAGLVEIGVDHAEIRAVFSGSHIEDEWGVATFSTSAT